MSILRQRVLYALPLINYGLLRALWGVPTAGTCADTAEAVETISCELYRYVTARNLLFVATSVGVLIAASANYRAADDAGVSSG